jgi:hypothetical protein
MKDMFRFVRDVLLFRDEAYVEHAYHAGVMRRGLLILIVATLVAGSVSFLIDLVQGLRPVDAEAQRRAVEASFEQFNETLEMLEPFLDTPPAFDPEEILAYVRPSVEISSGIAALPTPLPKVVGRLLEAVGEFLSRPFRRLAGWMGYTIWVLLFAKLLGGRATLARALGSTALYAIPHALGLLSFIPCLGVVVGWVATLWGIAVYVKALAVANDFSLARAVVATILPTLLVVLVGLVLLVFQVGFIALAGA